MSDAVEIGLGIEKEFIFLSIKAKITRVEVHSCSELMKSMNRMVQVPTRVAAELV